ncbi:MAG: hypothetical protein Q9222_003169 [Ikaeria aurantiellina]
MPSQGSVANRRFLVLIVSAIGLLAFLSIFFRSAPQRGHFLPGDPVNELDLNPDALRGEVVAGKIANETIKYFHSSSRHIQTLISYSLEQN